jgi:arylsulfatase A-like enzyme
MKVPTDSFGKRGVEAIANCIHQVLIWLPVAAMGLYLKFFELQHGGARNATLALGLDSSVRGRPFSHAQMASFYRGELLWGVLIVPIVLSVLTFFGIQRLQRAVLTVASLILIAVMIIQLESLIVLGAFQPWTLVSDGLEWWIRNSAQANGYVKLGKSVVLAIILAVLALGFALFPRPLIGRYVAPSLLRHKRAGLALSAVCCAGVAFTWLPWLPATQEHRFLLPVAARTFYGAALTSEEIELSRLSSSQLMERYQSVSGSPKQLPSQYFGKGKGYDVLFFVMETMPSLCVSFDGPMDALPNMASLKDAAFVASAHHSTYPLTVRALFSVMTGMYPPDGRSSSLTVIDRSNQNWQQAFAGAGYQTALYSGSIPPGDRETFQGLGFRKIYPSLATVQTASAPAGIARAGNAWATVQLRRDGDALEELTKDVSQWIDHDQRYTAVYLPKVSHGPWVDIRNGGAERDLMQRGRNLAVQVDSRLGEILALLARKGRLQRTLIVVTADHGLRTWAESPKGLSMLTDEYAFGVPFLLYAPGILNQTQRLPYLTSHIDIEPSIMDLLGISSGRDREQGTPVWDQRLASRRTYFWANEYLGSDVMFDSGVFHAWNRGAGLVYSNPHMHFSPADAERDTSPAGRRTTDEISRMDAIRIAWFRSHAD